MHTKSFNVDKVLTQNSDLSLSQVIDVEIALNKKRSIRNNQELN
jgi:hypothetical protein